MGDCFNFGRYVLAWVIIVFWVNVLTPHIILGTNSLFSTWMYIYHMLQFSLVNTICGNVSSFVWYLSNPLRISHPNHELYSILRPLLTTFVWNMSLYFNVLFLMYLPILHTFMHRMNHTCIRIREWFNQTCMVNHLKVGLDL